MLGLQSLRLRSNGLVQESQAAELANHPLERVITTASLHLILYAKPLRKGGSPVLLAGTGKRSG